MEHNTENKQVFNKKKKGKTQSSEGEAGLALLEKW